MPGARGRRVPPRIGQQRGRRGARTASWDGARRWWLVALGALALALILPRLASAQGLRSREVAVTLRVTAPPRVHESAEGVITAAWMGASVADFRIPLPTATVTQVAARLEEPGGADGMLMLRRADGALVPVHGGWVATSPAASEGAVVLRLTSLGGAPLDAGTWWIRLRTSRGDAAGEPLEQRIALVVPERR